jgi:hypothetical protein
VSFEWHYRQFTCTVLEAKKEYLSGTKRLKSSLSICCVGNTPLLQTLLLTALFSFFLLGAGAADRTVTGVLQGYVS